MSNNWNESDHPRDDIGRFTYKGEGSTVTTNKSYDNDMQRRADILFPTMTMKDKQDKEVFTGGAAQIVIDEIAGVKKGPAMPLEQAINGVNPDYNIFGNITNKTNCQACVAAAEARVRGFDVEVSIEFESEFKNKFSEYPNIAYIDPKTGRTPEFTRIKVKNEDECENWLNDNIKQGERYIFGFTWKQQSYTGKPRGHIVIATKNANNELQFHDAQNRIVYDASYLINIKYNFDWSEEPQYPKILRVDNKELNYKVMNKITKPARKRDLYN